MIISLFPYNEKGVRIDVDRHIAERWNIKKFLLEDKSAQRCIPSSENLSSKSKLQDDHWPKFECRSDEELLFSYLLLKRGYNDIEHAAQILSNTWIRKF